MHGSPELLELDSIGKAYPGVRALHDVSLSIRPGECLALVGENGAGKSTLLKILGGVVPPDLGAIRWSGNDVQIAGIRESQALGIRLIHQEVVLAPDLSVAENILLGSFPSRGPAWFPLVDRRRMEQQARAVLDRLGVELDVQAVVGSLNMASSQLVEIARAICCQAKLVIFDEPTSSLSDEEGRRLLALIKQLCSEGVAIIYVSHRLEEVMQIADRIMVLRDGAHVTTLPRSEASPQRLANLMVGRALDFARPAGRKEPLAGPPAFEICNFRITKSAPAVSFRIQPGEIVGLAGLVGAGRSELVRAIFRIDAFHSGETFVNGRRLKGASPLSAVRAGVALAPDDRKSLGLFIDMSVQDNISMVVRRRIDRFGRFNWRSEESLALNYRRELGIRTPSVSQKVLFLSGGNQQKVVLAKWLAANPNVLILDEPTRGVDLGARQECYRLIESLAGKGVAVLVISNELEELIRLADRVLVMRQGAIVGELIGESITEQAMMDLALGLKKVHVS